MEHTIRHARVHDQLASNPQYAGGIGWCAFDYNTHFDFGSGDRICYHGVMDIFREPKPAAGFYKSQCDPEEEVVLEPAFSWARGDESIGFRKAMFSSNCDHLKIYVGGRLVAEADPDREQFAHLRYAPFTVDLSNSVSNWGDLRVEGYLEGKQVIVKSFSGKGIDQAFEVLPDDTTLCADGADTTRVTIRFRRLAAPVPSGFVPASNPARCVSPQRIPFLARNRCRLNWFPLPRKRLSAGGGFTRKPDYFDFGV